MSRTGCSRWARRKGLLAHRCSLRDNCPYRAAFAFRNRSLHHLSGDPHDHRHQHPDRPPLTRRCASVACRRPGPADALESVLSDNTRRVYAAQWRLFTNWCDSVGLTPLPAEPLAVARYLTVRAGEGASIATMRLAISPIAKAHDWAGHESPGRDQGVRASLKGWGRRLSKPQRQAGALTTDVQAEERARWDVALVAVLSDAGLRRSEASSLTWGDAQC